MHFLKRKKKNIKKKPQSASILSMNPSLYHTVLSRDIILSPLCGDGDIWIVGLLFYVVRTVLFFSFCHQDCFVLKSFPVTGQTCLFFAQWTWVTTPFGYRTNVGSLKARLHTAHILQIETNLVNSNKIFWDLM